MKKHIFFLALLLVVILSSFLTYKFYNYYIIEETFIFTMEVKVDDHFGLNADTDALRFGKLMHGTSAQRSVSMGNNATFPLKVAIFKFGQMKDWVKISENNFVLKINETKSIIFEAYAPENIDFGNYSGKVKIIFKKTLRLGGFAVKKLGMITDSHDFLTWNYEINI